MSFIGTAIVAVVGSAIYTADKNRKLAHQQADALKASQEQDARDAAEAETSAAVAANQKLADSKRRRRASNLGVDPMTSALGGPATALGAVGQTVRPPSTPSGSGGSAIGSAAPAGAPATAPAYGGGGGGGGRYTQLPY